VKAADLVAKHESMSDEDFLREIAKLSVHEKDLLVPCKVCGAAEGIECKEVKKGLPKKKRRAFEWQQGVTVHIGRRIRRLLKGIR
jgi:hypothetical protein